MMINCKLMSLLVLTSGVLTLYGQSNSQGCEYKKATIILTHEPGNEFFLGVLHPTAALFENYMDINKVVAEHRNYRQKLQNSGAQVLTVGEILTRGTMDNSGNMIEGEQLTKLRHLAEKFLTFKKDKPNDLEATQQSAYLQSILKKATPQDLVKIILLQPTISLISTATNTKLTAEYAVKPVMNLFYMRDQMITTAQGTIIGRMNSPQREKECDIAEFCLNKIGIPAIHRIAGDGAYLEGGDFYPFGNIAFIGCGMRTTQNAIDQLMEHNLLGCDTLVVVNDKRLSQAQMHLDTYFNIIDRDLVTLSTERMTIDPESPMVLYVDIYVRGTDEKYKKVEDKQLFYTFLTDHLKVDIIPVSNEDNDRLANNFLTVAPRQIMAVDGQSEAFREIMRKKGVDVEWIKMDNLKKGYGAAHCMTQVLSRKR